MSSKIRISLCIACCVLICANLSAQKYGYSGVKINYQRGMKYPQVIYAIVGSPAFDAGLKPNDYITAVNDSTTQGLRFGQVIDMIERKPNEQIKVTLLRGDQSLTVSLTLIPWNDIMERKTAYLFNTTMQGHELPENTPVFTNYAMLFNKNDQTNYAQEATYMTHGVFGRVMYRFTDYGTTTSTLRYVDVLGSNNIPINLRRNLNRLIFVDTPTVGTNGIYFLVKETNSSNSYVLPVVVNLYGDIVCSANYNEHQYNGKHISDMRFLSGDILALQAHASDDKKQSWCTWNMFTNTFSDYNFKSVSTYTNGHAIARTNSNQIVLIDEEGKIIKKLAKAESDDYFSEGDVYGNFFGFRKNKATQFMDINGNELFKVDQYVFASHYIGYNIMSFNFGNYSYPVWKYIYTNGAEYNYPGLEKLEPFQFGRAKIKTTNGYGYINEAGQLAIPDTFLNATNFNRKYNYAAVQRKTDMLWLIIDSSGTPMGDLGSLAGLVEMEDDGLFKITRNTKDKLSTGDGPYATYFADVYGHHYYDFDKTKPLEKNPDYAKFQNELDAATARIKAQRQKDEEERQRYVQSKKATLSDDTEIWDKPKSSNRTTRSSGGTTSVPCSACHGSGQIHQTIYGGTKGANGQPSFGSYSSCTACSGRGSVSVKY